ncbi:PhnD/SsuA/transferrin family substrate-binding protein, partial [Blastococcus sp. TF02A-35]|uniref:PhnD/SsuA/transferrin family substrate-binding protein n=1 Tax=Blastococcus sp. TF02A-35 TaxID=2559612 RepID=UPI0032AF377F
MSTAATRSRRRRPGPGAAGGAAGGPGFSGSHDATIALVASGSYQAGVLNEQVWESRLAEGGPTASDV